MHNPKVSIIVPTYNYAPFLPQALESALDQSYPEIEIIVVNDGSTDNTSEVVKPYLDRITYLEQPNSGVVVARNRGARQANGEYLLFLDADDYLEKSFIESCLQVLRAHAQASFVYTDRQVVGDRQFRYDSVDWNPSLLLLSNYIGLSTLIRREAFESVGGFHLNMNRQKSYEDWDLWLSLMKNGYVGIYNPKAYYFHRKLYAGSRNDAGVILKLRLRRQLLKQHWRLLLRPVFWWQLFGAGMAALIRKWHYIKQSTA